MGGVWPAGHGGLVRSLISPRPYGTALLPEVSVRRPRHSLPSRQAQRERTLARVCMDCFVPDSPLNTAIGWRPGWAPTPTAPAEEAPALTRQAPRWSRSRGGPLAHAAGAPVVA